jgi:hypothetical protein
MYQQTRGKVLADCPSKEQRGSAMPSLECNVADVVRISTDELEVVLAGSPRIGGLLTLHLSRDTEHSPTIVARVTAVRARPQGGWLVHCKPVLPLTKSHLGTSLRPCVA